MTEKLIVVFQFNRLQKLLQHRYEIIGSLGFSSEYF